MACSGCRPFPHQQPLGTLLLGLLPILWQGLPWGFMAAASAKEAMKPICCRASGGTRGTCLNAWAHLVPASNRFQPGDPRTIALVLGRSPSPTAMTIQLSTQAGELVGEQTLPARGSGVWLLTLPEGLPPARSLPLVWESFPTCRPNKPPTRSSLVAADPPTDQGGSQGVLAALRQSCGREVATAPLLRAFGMEDLGAKLPPMLPVQCETLTLGSLGITNAPGSGSKP